MIRPLDRRCHAQLACRAMFVLGLVAGLCSVVGEAGAQERQLLPQIIVTGDPVGQWPTDPNTGMQYQGIGMCGAFRTLVQAPGAYESTFSQRPADFPNHKEDFPDSVNAFMDGGGLGGTVKWKTLQTYFDLSNQYNSGSVIANGDYVRTPTCYPPSELGCNFPATDMTDDVFNGFGERVRGYFNVQPNWVGQPMHFGIRAATSAAVQIFSMPTASDSAKTVPHRDILISRGWGSSADIRVTNTVTFMKSGLYPIEVLFSNPRNYAILEMAVLFNSPNFTDVDGYVSSGQPLLSTLAFDMQYTAKTNFFQTATGLSSFSSVDQCQQCPRQYAKPSVLPLPNGICPPNGWFCNAAALCEYCPFDKDATLCTPNCIRCQKPTPICWRRNSTDPGDSDCVECLADSDCQNGFACVNHACQVHRPPALACPGGAGVAVGPDLQPTSDCGQVAGYSPCSKDADCPNGQICDLPNTRCVDSLPDCRFDNKCGKDCVDCANVAGTGRPRPHCLNGMVCVECRIDTDCSEGNYCLSGDCVPCTDDRHCGPGCGNCTYHVGAAPTCSITVSDTPFCYSPNSSPSTSTCVGCLKDSDCGDNGTCDPTAHTCTNQPTTGDCPSGTFRKGDACVQCVSDSQCLCGSCDTSSNSCVNICKDNTDCQGNQCCAIGPDGIRACQSGRCAGTAGGALCGCAVTNKGLGIASPDNNTLSADGGEVGRSRGALIAMVAMLLAGILLRRARLPALLRREVMR